MKKKGDAEQTEGDSGQLTGLAEHNAFRALEGLPPVTQAEYEAMLAGEVARSVTTNHQPSTVNAGPERSAGPAFDWTGLRKALEAKGAGPDDELIQLCKQHELVQAAMALQGYKRKGARA